MAAGAHDRPHDCHCSLYLVVCVVAVSCSDTLSVWGSKLSSDKDAIECFGLTIAHMGSQLLSSYLIVDHETMIDDDIYFIFLMLL
jgi:hypothetical protein